MRLGALLVSAIAWATACLGSAAHADPAAPGTFAPALNAAAPATQSVGISVPEMLVLPALGSAPFQGSVNPRFRAQAPAPDRASSRPWGVFSGDWQNANLLGDIGGLRPALAKYGVTLQLYEEAETFGNLTGGVRHGFEVNGVTTAQVQLDTKPLFGLAGGIFSVSGFHIWGGDLSASNLMNLQTVSGLETNASTRLWELWYQQNFGDRFDVKIGEQSLDNEFMMSQNAGYFLNSVMGWPMLPSANLPGGGPAYPLAGFGVRARAHPSDAVTIMAGVFNGSPIPLNSPNTPLSNPNGVSFPLNTGVLAIAELQYTFPAATPSGKPAADGPLPGTYKLGAWWDSEDFDDQQHDNLGVPLASPRSDGIPAEKQGNYLDLCRGRGPDDLALEGRPPARSAPSSVRCSRRCRTATSSPSASTAVLPCTTRSPGRDNDVFGLGFGVARVTNGVADYDSNCNLYEPASIRLCGPRRRSWRRLSAQILPSWQFQPDVQYVINPGAGSPIPDAPTQKVRRTRHRTAHQPCV